MPPKAKSVTRALIKSIPKVLGLALLWRAYCVLSWLIFSTVSVTFSCCPCQSRAQKRSRRGPRGAGKTSDLINGVQTSLINRWSDRGWELRELANEIDCILGFAFRSFRSSRALHDYLLVRLVKLEEESFLSCHQRVEQTVAFLDARFKTALVVDLEEFLEEEEGQVAPSASRQQVDAINFEMAKVFSDHVNLAHPKTVCPS